MCWVCGCLRQRFCVFVYDKSAQVTAAAAMGMVPQKPYLQFDYLAGLNKTTLRYLKCVCAGGEVLAINDVKV